MKCEFGRDFIRVSNGVFIGKGDICVVLRDEEFNIKICLFINFEI